MNGICIIFDSNLELPYTNTECPPYSTHLTQHPGIVRHALAYKAILHLMTATTVLTGAAGTFVSLDLTVGAYKSWRTLAVVSSQRPSLEMNQIITDSR